MLNGLDGVEARETFGGDDSLPIEVVEGGTYVIFYHRLLFVRQHFVPLNGIFMKDECGVGEECCEECVQFECISMRENFTILYYVDAKRKRNVIK